MPSQRKALELCTYIASIAVIILAAAALVTGSARIWGYITRLGDEEFYLVMGVLAYYLAPNYALGLGLLLSVLLSGSLNISLKYLVNAPRPPDPLIPAEGPAFPSGHAQVSSSFWTAISIASNSRAVALFSAIVVAAISMSRVALRAHYPIDVIGGAAIGALCGAASIIVARELGRGRGPAFGAALALSALLNIFSIYALGAEIGASSALLGLSVGVSPSLSGKIRGELSGLSGIPVPRRLAGAAISSLVLVIAHALTKGAGAYIRAPAFAIGGLVALILVPLFVAKKPLACCR